MAVGALNGIDKLLLDTLGSGLMTLWKSRSRLKSSIRSVGRTQGALMLDGVRAAALWLHRDFWSMSGCGT